MSNQASSESPTTTGEDQLADLPGFQTLPPTTTRPADELDPEAMTTISPPRSWEDDEAGWLEGDDEEGDRPKPAGGRSSTASTEPVNAAELVPLAATLVGLASMLIRFLRARRRPHLPPSVWIADEEDTAIIAEPLARIAARRSPISGQGAADTTDGLALVVGAANYAVKNVQLEAEADEYAAAGEPVPHQLHPDTDG